MTTGERSNVASLDAARRRLAKRGAATESVRPAADAHAEARPGTRRPAPSGDRRGQPQGAQRHPAGTAHATRRTFERKRVFWLFMIFVLLLGLEVLRLVQLQGFGASHYRELAQNQRLRSEKLSTPRGDILDRDGRPLAVSVVRKTVVADPSMIDDPQTTANLLAGALRLDPRDLVPKLSGDRRFSYVARRVEDDAAQRVSELRLKGITTVNEPKRYYPGGPFAANLLGFVGGDNEGLAGIEQQAQQTLAGTPGAFVVEQDPQGRPIPQAEYKYEAPEPGRDVFLTIDSEIQYQAERILAESVQTYKAKGGAILVLDVKTGDILAAANNPTFDPNSYWLADAESRKNRIATDAYEPGSTNKVITMSGAIEDKVVSLDEKIGIPNRYKVADAEFKDAEDHPAVAWNLRNILVHSSNIGTIKVAQRMGADRVDRYMKAFGYGQTTGSGFPGESPGLLLPRDKWSGTTIATVPIGQGIAVTGIQMAQVYATVANGGVWVAPRLVAGPKGADGRIEASQAPVGRRVISSETAGVLRSMLGGVVAEGTGRMAEVQGYQVAGKTGTARKPSPNGGYLDSYIGSFVGFAPVDDPRVVMAVVLDEPTPYFGGLSAAPTWSKLMGFTLHHMAVPPQGKQTELAEGPVRALPTEDVPGGARRSPSQAATPPKPQAGQPQTSGQAGTPAGGTARTARR